MKTKNIIKLTRNITNVETTKFFIEGLTVNINRETTQMQITASNNDFSDHKVDYTFHLYLNWDMQIEELILMMDDLNYHHERLKRLKRVTNNQAK